MASKTVHPVETLREHATALEAAMTVVLADPRKPAVHKVRAMVRRLEAQLELLAQLAALPPGSAETEDLHRRLRKLGRAAGRVRDLDVQRKMLKAHPSLPRRAAAELREELKDARESGAKKLQRALTKQLPRIAGAIEGLVASVGTANGLVLPDLRLIPLIERWTLAHRQEAPDLLDDEQLHSARKTAKTARYMVENATGSPAAQRAAARYDEQQDAGGRWHDWVDLAETAREYFGKNHPLTVAAGKQCKSARAKYVKLLERLE
ncbi:MAG TPA: CHAD domain-containing protein [Acidobacteriaceae bacterium]|nr:CHAD domain-containing protein [Acidobacteriaceae bacterium]